MIVDLCLQQELEQIEARRYDSKREDLAEGVEEFERPVVERLTRRPC